MKRPKSKAEEALGIILGTSFLVLIAVGVLLNLRDFIVTFVAHFEELFWLTVFFTLFIGIPIAALVLIGYLIHRIEERRIGR